MVQKRPSLGLNDLPSPASWRSPTGKCCASSAPWLARERVGSRACRLEFGFSVTHSLTPRTTSTQTLVITNRSILDSSCRLQKSRSQPCGTALRRSGEGDFRRRLQAYPRRRIKIRVGSCPGRCFVGATGTMGPAPAVSGASAKATPTHSRRSHAPLTSPTRHRHEDPALATMV